jgi:uncharacterized protein (DUF1697 family)
MIYVALLRGINVGGNSQIKMAELKAMFEKLGFTDVKTYINSGNVIFTTAQTNALNLQQEIEKSIEKDFNFSIKVMIRSHDQIELLVKEIPDAWVNDKTMKCDVLFLDKEVDNAKILNQLPHNPELENIKYIKGAVVWRIDRDKVTKSKMYKIVGTPFYKQITARNPNTVRKIYSLMNEINH